MNHLTWRTLAEAQAHYGRSDGCLRGWAREGKLLRRTEAGRVYFATNPDRVDEVEPDMALGAAVPPQPQPQPEPQPEPQPQPQPQEAPPAGHDADPECILLTPDDGWVERPGYVYDGARHVYVIHTPSTGGQTVMPGDRLHAIWQAYTEPNAATSAEICREFGMSEATWQDVKGALRLTHKRAPWPDEHVASTPASVLVEDAIKRKEQAVLQRAQRAEWRRVADDAERWRNLRASVLDHIGARISPVTFDTCYDDELGGVHYLLGASDLHVGKRSHGVVDETLSDQVSMLEDVLGRACRHVISCRDGAAAVVPIGSDGLHSDTKHMTTTRGTPQGAQSLGSIYQQFDAYVSLMGGVISLLAGSMPVRCVWVRGNHDELLSYMAASVLAAQFGHNKGVEFDMVEQARKLVRCGDTPLILTHGDKIKDHQLPAMVAAMVPRDMSLGHAVVARGHVHHSKASLHELGGYDVLTLSSAAGTDDWHHEEGYDLAQQRVAVAALRQGLEGVRWFKASGA
jgi:hypothetical protein